MSTGICLDTKCQELHITRWFKASRASVWRAWTHLPRARKWWGPRGFTVSELELAMQPGGIWRAVMHSTDDQQYPQRGVLREIVAPHRLAFALMWDARGPATEMLVTVQLTPRDGGTQMTFHKGPFPTEAWRRCEEKGWYDAFDRLRALVET